MEPKNTSAENKTILVEKDTEPIISIETYCNLYNIDSKLSYIYGKSFSGAESRSKQEWDSFLSKC